jgi:hypothetical protein
VANAERLVRTNVVGLRLRDQIDIEEILSSNRDGIGLG